MSYGEKPNSSPNDYMIHVRTPEDHKASTGPKATKQHAADQELPDIILVGLNETASHGNIPTYNVSNKIQLTDKMTQTSTGIFFYPPETSSSSTPSAPLLPYSPYFI
jgi:hypothetical protein